MDNYTGKRLDGRYEIQEVIGVGGMAVVYKAYDNIDDRIVAVKILKDEYLANEEFRRRFKNESKAIAVLSHPNIVKVFNVSYGDRLQYIVMEYVEGITLKEYIEQQGKLGIKETVHFTMQILRALQHAHDKGIVHRDIKPQNIMLLSNGNIKVTDFGIARFSYSDTKTMTDSAIGSVHYISPEQARGGTTDDRADIYSVGVVMYEMLTGQVPFQSDNSVSVALMQLQNEAKRPRELNNNIPVGLEQIVMHAMRKNTRERYQSAAEMLLDIEEFKRNPTIRFQKDYFVDNDPTKYVNKKPEVAVKPAVPPVAPVVVPPVPPVAPGFGLEDDEDDADSRNRVGAAIIGVVVGLVLAAIVSIAVLWFVRPDVIDSIPGISTLLKADERTVEDFVNMNYKSQIDGKTKYSSYKFIVIEQPNASYKNGVVHAQSPAPGTERKKGDEVTLYVTNNNKKVIVPDLENEHWEQAKRTLEDMGFEVVLRPEINFNYDVGSVLRTEPSKGSEVAERSKITVVYSQKPDNEIAVVNVVNMDVEMAKELLESQNLRVVVKEENSDKKFGVVLDQNPKDGEKLFPGQEVTLTVSNGIPASAEATITFDLPSKSSRGTLEVYVNNDFTKEVAVLLDGSSYNLKVTGSGDSSLVKIRVDGRDYYSCIVNFNTAPPTVVSGAYASIMNSTSGKIPNVTGKSEAQAKAELNAAGFWNISVTETIVADETQVGIVQSQNPSTPDSSSIIAQTYPFDKKIEISVGQLEGV